VVAEGGRIFATLRLYFQNTEGLFALNASDGSLLWKKSFDGLFSVGQPAVFDGQVYVANGKAVDDKPALLWSLVANNGSLTWVSNLSAQWDHYFAPIVADGMVYTNSGYYGGLFGVSLDDGSNVFMQTGLEQVDEWSPAYFDGAVYTFVGGTLRKHDPKTGAILSHTSVAQGGGGGTAPVFGDTLAYVIASGLYAVDPVKSEIAWSSTGAYSGTPAFSDGLVYALSAGNLLVRHADTGKLAWSFVADGKLSYPPVIANGYVYVASSDHVYGVGLSSHEAEFQADGGGWLSISDHRLFVASDGGTLTAYVMSLP
jgi:outer membrane protein assembly factor BamB